MIMPQAIDYSDDSYGELTLSHPNIPKQRSLTITSILNDRTPTSPNSYRTQLP